MLSRPGAYRVFRKMDNRIKDDRSIPVMQSRLLSLPELKKGWCQSVATPVFRLRNQATAVTEQARGLRFKTSDNTANSRIQ
jgi:putative component of toxin-antitoxin plasmid stabilization module